MYPWWQVWNDSELIKVSIHQQKRTNNGWRHEGNKNKLFSWDCLKVRKTLCSTGRINKNSRNFLSLYIMHQWLDHKQYTSKNKQLWQLRPSVVWIILGWWWKCCYVKRELQRQLNQGCLHFRYQNRSLFHMENSFLKKKICNRLFKM